jgi:PKD repeat protein
VIFDATPSSAGATSWTWDFGDNTAASSGQRVTHTFTRPGSWVVRLTITVSGGRSATITKSVTVRS